MKKDNYLLFLERMDLLRYVSEKETILDYIRGCSFPTTATKLVGIDFFFNYTDYTLKQVGKLFGISSERVRQQNAKFIKLMLNGSRYEGLLCKLDESFNFLIFRRNDLQCSLNSINMDIRQYRGLHINQTTAGSIRDCEFSIRTWNVLENAGIKTIYELSEYTEQDLLKLKNCGKKSLNEINQVLNSFNLQLFADLQGEDHG